jgi:hypothetical protein
LWVIVFAIGACQFRQAIGGRTPRFQASTSSSALFKRLTVQPPESWLSPRITHPHFRQKGTASPSAVPFPLPPQLLDSCERCSISAVQQPRQWLSLVPAMCAILALSA